MRNCIIEEVQAVAALGHVYNVLAVQGVVGGAGAGCHLLHTQAVSVVLEGYGFTRLRHALKLAALFPGVRPGAVAGRGTNGTEKATRQCRMAGR